MINLDPKKFSQLDQVDTLDGQELIPIVKNGENKTVKVEDLPGGTGAVDSVFGRAGDVVAQTGDYNETQIAIEDPTVYEDLTGGTVTGNTVKELIVSMLISFGTTISGIIEFISNKAFDKTVDTLDDITPGTTNKHFTATDETKLDGIEAGADVTDAQNVGAVATAAAAKTTPVDADTLPLSDSAASNVLKKVTWSNIKATLKTYFDTLYATTASVSAKQSTSEKDQNNGYAGLDSSGKLNPNQLPSLALSETFTVASQAAMLALSAQQGDVAIRTDLNKSFILSTNSPSVLADWKELLSPTGAVSTVFGRSGDITAQSGDYTASQVTNTPAGNIGATTVQAAINELDTEKQPLDADLTTIAGLDSAQSGVIASDGAGWLRKTYAQLKTALSITKSDVGLGNVTNDEQIPKSLIDAEGDLIVGDADNTPKKLAIGERASVLSPNASGELAYSQVVKHPVKVPVGSYFLTSRQLGTGYSAAGTSSTAVSSNNRFKNTPFVVDEITRVDRIALYVVGTNDTGSVRLGIYEDDGNGGLGNVIADGGLSSIAVAGVKTQTIDAVLYPDKIYHAIGMTEALNTAGGNPTFASAGASTAAAPEDAPAASNNMFTFRVWSMTAGGLTNNPTVPGNSRSLTTGVPHIWLRRAAL